MGKRRHARETEDTAPLKRVKVSSESGEASSNSEKASKKSDEAFIPKSDEASEIPSEAFGNHDEASQKAEKASKNDTEAFQKAGDASGNDDDALALVIESTDDLIDCLRCLKAESQRGGQSSSTAEKLSSLSAKLLPSFQKLAGKKDTIQPAAKAEGLEVPHPTFITKWKSSEITHTLPPLPKILDSNIKRAALTHTGQNVEGVNYERLEWLGDAYLEMFATALIYQTFPDVREGVSAQHREMLVRNITLSEFTKKYGIDKLANLPPEYAETVRHHPTAPSNAKRVKALGDLFEAYVGAIILADPKDGVRRAAEWVKALWGPLLEKHILLEESRLPGSVDKVGPKTRLENMLYMHGVKIEYRDMPSKAKKHRDHKIELFTVGCFLHGYTPQPIQIGWGSAPSKKDAGARAAQMALDGTNVLKPFVEQKQRFDAARKEQAAAAKAAKAKANASVTS